MKLITVSVLFLISYIHLINGYYHFMPPTVQDIDSWMNNMQSQWQNFVETNNKQYKDSKEEEFRFHVYAYNTFKIKLHNIMYDFGKYSYKLKMNEYGDLTAQEFGLIKKGYFGLLTNETDFGVGERYFYYTPKGPVNKTVDWRKLGAVTEVKNQGNCGSCWSFSTTGSLEGQHFLKTGKLVPLSEQNLIDCSYFNGNNGCNGGLMEDAFRYIKENGGIDAEKDYPYEGIDFEFCRYNPQKKAATVNGFTTIPKGNETLLKYAVATVGPVSVGIDASSSSFQFYSEGVYNDLSCSSSKLDHGVLVVGYGTTEDGKDYWLVKNSWGPKWGDKGYIKMSRNKDNQCGIASYALFPLV